MLVIRPTQASNTPTQASAATALAANAGRIGWSIQNQSTNTLFVLLGSGASSTVYHVALKGCTGANDGSGGIFTMTNGAVYTGIVTIAGTNPSYTVLDMTP